LGGSGFPTVRIDNRQESGYVRSTLAVQIDLVPLNRSRVAPRRPRSLLPLRDTATPANSRHCLRIGGDTCYNTNLKSLPAAAQTRLKTNAKRAFNAQDFLDSAGVARKVTEFGKKATVFSQGDPGKHVLYIQKGGVRLSVVNETGKEAVVAVLGPGDFFGEGCLAGQPVRIGTATTIAPTTVLVIEKSEMIRVLHAEHEFSDRFISYMLERNIRVEEDLVDQLFNSSEKRLARTLLLLARYGKQDKPQRVLPKISQEMLAEMVGTTRSRVNFFMNKFKKLGFIKYNGGLQINTSLLSVVLHD
jgi:CRP/FNR family transcriptional regulator, cyclic AMP receptor protein